MAEGRDLPSEGDLLGGGKYRVVRRVGAGGMGAVFEAINLDTTRRVAIKVLHPDLASRPHVARRFAQEARAACRIEHPNIVGVFDLIQEGATIFIVEEFLDGEDMKQRVTASGPMGAAEALRAAIPVMEALQYAHGRGVIHRDVKPDNLFLARSPRGVVPKVIDFGIARVIDDEGESLQGTALGEVMGTAYYMSPEQARGDLEQVDGRTDVWSLGAVLYFVVSGARPYEASNRHQLLYRITHDPPIPVTERAKGVAPEFAELVHRALAQDLDRRFASMELFLEAARRCLHVIEDRTEVVALPPPELSVSEATLTSIPLDASHVDALDDERDAPTSTTEPVAGLVSAPAPVTTTTQIHPDGSGRVAEVTPASWEMPGSLVVPRQVRKGVWAMVFAAAIALGAVVGFDARATRPRHVAAARPPRISAPALGAHPLVPAPVVPAPVVPAPVAPAPVAPAPVAIPVAIPVAVPAPPRRAPLVRAPRPARPLRRILPLAPNPYGDDPDTRAMPPGLWAPR